MERSTCHVAIPPVPPLRRSGYFLAAFLFALACAAALVAFAPGKALADDIAYDIYSADDFVKWRNTTDGTGTAYLRSDITITDVDLLRIIEWEKHNLGENETLEGLGYGITLDLKTSPGLFVEVRGSIRSIHFHGSVDCPVSGVGAAAGNLFAPGRIFDCVNYADITGVAQVGGLVGTSKVESSASNNSYTMFNNCANHGNVTATGKEGVNRESNAGGITGTLHVDEGKGHEEESTAHIAISQCYNRGDVSGVGKEVAGIVGTASTETDLELDRKSAHLWIEYCFNTGNVITDYKDAAGIVAHAKGDVNITNCYSAGYVSAKDDDFTNKGIVQWREIDDGDFFNNCTHSESKDSYSLQNGQYANLKNYEQAKWILYLNGRHDELGSNGDPYERPREGVNGGFPSIGDVGEGKTITITDRDVYGNPRNESHYDDHKGTTVGYGHSLPSPHQPQLFDGVTFQYYTLDEPDWDEEGQYHYYKNPPKPHDPHEPLGWRTQDVFLYYTSDPLTVYFDANVPEGATVEGAYPTEKTVYYGFKYGEMPEPYEVNNAWRFEGWFDSDGQEYTSKSGVYETGTQTLYAHWYKYPATVIEQPADTAVNRGDRVEFSVKATIPDEIMYDKDLDKVLYEWHRKDGKDDEAYDYAYEHNNFSVLTIDSASYSEGNTYYYCDIYASYKDGKKTLIGKSRLAKLTVYPGSQIEASVEQNQVVIHPETADWNAQAGKTHLSYEYDFPVDVKLLDSAYIDGVESATLNISILNSAGVRTFTYDIPKDELSLGKTYSYQLDGVRMNAGSTATVEVDGCYWVKRDGENRHEAVTFSSSAPFLAPSLATAPETLGKPVFYKGGIPDDIWNPSAGPLTDRMHHGDDVTAAVDMTWGSDFDSSTQVMTEWRYSLDNETWLTLETTDQKVDSQQVDGVWKTRVMAAFNPKLEYNKARVQAVVRTMEDGQTTISDSSDPILIEISAPTNVHDIDPGGASTQRSIHWDWNEDIQGVPSGGTEEGTGFLVTYTCSTKVYSEEKGEYTTESFKTIEAPYKPGADSQSVALKDLILGTEYRVTVQAYGNGELGSKSDSITFNTEGLPPGEIDLEPRVAAAAVGEEGTFEVRYTLISGESISAYHWSTSADGTNWEEGDESLKTKEAINVAARKDVPVFVKCAIDISSDDGAPPKTIETPVGVLLPQQPAPVILETKPQTYSAHLKWEKGPGASLDESNYLVRYARSDDEPKTAQDPAWNYVEVSGSESVTITGLDPGKENYHWQVAVRTAEGGIVSDWTKWNDGEFTTKKAAKAEECTLVWGGRNPEPVSGKVKFRAEYKEPDKVSKNFNYTYAWQYYNAAKNEWVNDRNDWGSNTTESPSFDRIAAGADDYGRAWRCVVTVESGDDSTDTFTTNTVTPTFCPPQMRDLWLESGTDTIEVAWPLLDRVGAYEITYGAVNSQNSVDDWKKVLVSSATSTETREHYAAANEDEGTRATYTLTGLSPETQYRVKIVGCKDGELGIEPLTKDAKTFPMPETPFISEQPGSRFASVGANNEVTFSAAVIKPNDGGTLSARLERYVPGADGAEGTWETVPDAGIAIKDDPSAERIARVSVTLAPSNETRWRYTDAAKLRFAVTNTLNGGTATEQSTPVCLVMLAVQPSMSAVPDSATATSIDVTLDGTLDDGTVATNRFTLLWTDDASLSTVDLSGWKRATVDADENGQAAYTIKYLAPDTAYRIVAVSAPVVNGMTLPPSKPSAPVEAATIKKNTLASVAVTPERTVAEEGTPVTLTATPAFDGDAAKVSYDWQQYTAESGWQDVADAPDAPEYTATVGTGLAGAYRCVATAGGALDPNMEEKTVASNRAMVWTDKRPGDPSGLTVAPQARSAELAWEGNDGFAGSYLVEYRVVGADVWLTANSDAPTFTLKNLEPSATYEWRVTAKGDNGLSSATVDGPVFSTKAGSALTKAQVTPSETVVTMEGDWKKSMTKLSVTDSAALDETRKYAWEYSDNDGASWTPIEGANESTYEARVPEFKNKEGESCVGSRLYRCYVAATASDDTVEVASSTAEVRLVPNVPTEARPKETETTEKATTLTWKPPEPAVPCGYEVQYRKQGESAWKAPDKIKVEVATDGSRWCRVTGLKPSTVYEWQVRAVGIPAGKDPAGKDPLDSKYATAWVDGEQVITKTVSGLDAAAVTPRVALYDPADEGALRFVAKTDAPSEKLSYEWQWQEASAEESDPTAWKKVSDYESPSHLIANDSVLEVTKEFRTSYPGARFRCAVTTNDPTLTKKTVTSLSAVMLSRLTVPYELEVSSISMTGAKVTWKDNNPYEGSYTLEYRAVGQPVSITSLVAASLPGTAMLSGEQVLQTSIDPSGWIPVEGLENKRYDFNQALEPGTTYEWRVKFVSDAGSVEGPVAYGSVFTTLSGSALTGAVVTPKIAVADKVGDEVTFTAVTNVDNVADENLQYKWQTAPRNSDNWQNLGKTEKELAVTVGDDLGTQYRCVVEASKNGDVKTVTSTPASLWKRPDVTPPSDLEAKVQSALKAELSWKCDAQVAGTYTVEYRAKDGAWQTVSGIADKKLVLDGLVPGTTYEWRVAHVLGNGLSSGFAPGREFTTREGSTLASVTVTPSSVTITDPDPKPVLTATTNTLPPDETVTYQWQYFSEPSIGEPQTWEDQDGPEAKLAAFVVPGMDQRYDTSLYRCVVTAKKNGDEKKVASAAVLVTLAPKVPYDLRADEIGKGGAKLQWKEDVLRGVEERDINYEVAWRVQGEGAWETANSRGSSASSDPWKKMSDGASFSLDGLDPSTAYEWRVRATSDDATVASEWSDISSFVTLGESGLSKAAVSPVLYRYDADADPAADAVFKVYADESTDKLIYQWQWKRYGEETWRKADDNSKFATEENGAKLIVREGFAKTKEAHASSYRCVVKTKEGIEPREATSSAALLLHQVAEPVNLDARNASTNSVALSWTDANQYEGTYTLQYRKAPVARIAGAETGFARAAATGDWMTREGIARNSSGTTTYTLDRLDPDTLYEWRVQFVPQAGILDESKWAEGAPFRTLPGSALNRAEVSPTFSLRDPGETVKLTVETNVDNALDEQLAYRWQKAERDSDQWTDVPNGRNAAFSVTVGDADWGVRYRCMVKATKNGNSTELASNEAVIWSSTALVAPRDLAVSGILPTAAKLSWACDAPVKGTYTVEYRVKGTDTWTVVGGLTAPELPLSGLSPATEYEWRVTHVVAEGVVSETVPGSSFTTLASGSGGGGEGGSGGGADGDAVARILAPTGDSAPITAFATTVLLAFAALAACIIRRASRRS